MADARSDAAAEYRRLYKSNRWRALRLSVLRGEPLCRMCKDAGRWTPATVVDHIKPHKGDEALFWSVANLQPICKPCHDGRKQADEKRGFSTAVGLDGWPTDPAHPVNAWGRR